MPAARIQPLHEHAWPRLRALRLASLRESPLAFGTAHDECLDWTESQWREQLRMLTTFVAVCEDRDVGLVRSVAHGELSSAVYLFSLWVAPDARQLGIGSLLVDAVVTWTRSLQRSTILLDVRDINRAAVAFYERLGFEPTGYVALDQGFTERQYRLELGPSAARPR